MTAKNFNIVSASAGTGKTYRLSKRYLLLLLGPDAYQKHRQLLAITFTNKAVGEMKERILENLHAFGKNPVQAKYRPLFDEIAQELHYTEAQLREKAKKTLPRLLRDYAFFDIITIDRFNHRLIRTFARDLKIAQNFEVELDTEYLLSLAVNRLLDKAGRDKELTQILMGFAFDKIDDDRSWNIAYDLQKIGKLLFDENHLEHLFQLSEKTSQDFLKLKDGLSKKKEILEITVKDSAKICIELISQNNLEQNDFKGNYFPKFLKEAADSPSGINFNAKWKTNFAETILYNKSLAEDKKAIIDSLMPRFLTHFETLKKAWLDWQFLSRCEKNIVPLAVLHQISKEMEQLKEDRAFLTIIEFNKLISEEIKKQPVPFIYERLGERYRHYFIDEFQDTSVLQWNNLLPLIGHALQSETLAGEPGSLFMVGDVKQSIYRWRGGDAQQFLNLILKKENPFKVEPSVEELQKNWRSFDEIIHFNNQFFSYIAESLSNPDFTKIYKSGNQQITNSKKGGFVQVSFVESTEIDTKKVHCTKVLEAITEITALGYALENICILVRKNDHAVLLAEFLNENHIPVVSNEALLLKNSEEVTFLIAFFQFLDSPNEKEYQFNILEFLLPNTGDLNSRYKEALSDFEGYLAKAFGVDIGLLYQFDLIDLLEYLIVSFDLVPESNAFVNAFIDVVADWKNQEKNTISAFLAYWNLKKERLSVSMPIDQNAVNIMTVHKSKGLEFPFVIFPFADGAINDSKKQDEIWFSVDPEKFEGFNNLMVTANKYMETFSANAQKAYHKEVEKSELDDFNVLYVALTRAVYGLFVISSAPSSSSSKDSYATFFQRFIEDHQFAETANSTFSIGNLLPNQLDLEPSVKSETVAYQYTGLQNFELATSTNDIIDENAKEAIKFGSILHQALALVYTKDDIESAITYLKTIEQLSEEVLLEIKQIIEAIVNHKLLSPYFSTDGQVKNEVDILDTNGAVLRPDKLILKDGKAVIIDYKTGIAAETHKNQIEQYAKVVTEMGYTVINKYVVYTNKTLNILSL